MILTGVTVALGAFLLFLVEPLAAKILLPLFGGTASVWLTSLLFFQVALLAGYVFADLAVRRLKPRQRPGAHLLLLALAALSLPLDAAPSLEGLLHALPDAFRAAPPAMLLLLLLARSIGLPFVALAATGPLAQALWAQGKTGSPYRLYALSNLASLLGLAAYPFVVEPRMTLHRQALLFSGAFILFAFCAAALSLLASLAPPAEEQRALVSGGAVPARAQALWLLLPACSSALLLAVTGHLTRNVAPIPLLWLLPLAAYLASFIFAFDSPRWVRRQWTMPAAIAGLAFLAFADGWIPPDTHLAWTIAAQVAAFFAVVLALHGELVALRPEAAQLTRFYLSLSLGGALGSLAVAVLVPLLFRGLAELALSLVAAAIACVACWWPALRARRFALSIRAALVIATSVLALALFLSAQTRALGDVFAARNFYGALHVQDQRSPRGVLRILFNGNTMHGVQLVTPRPSLEMLSYYSLPSGVGRTLTALRARKGKLRVGAVGLGAGILAGFCEPGDIFELYEINPLVERVAREKYTFLDHCAGATVHLGDARLVIAAQEPQAFDLIVLDAFNSDAIPVHLLTAEAFALYLKHLAPGGALAAHVSNRYLDLEPAVAAQAAPLGLDGILLVDNTKTEDTFPSEWVLLSADASLFRSAPFQSARIEPISELPKLRRWTDDYSNIAATFR